MSAWNKIRPATKHDFEEIKARFVLLGNRNLTAVTKGIEAINAQFTAFKTNIHERQTQFETEQSAINNSINTFNRAIADYSREPFALLFQKGTAVHYYLNSGEEGEGKIQSLPLDEYFTVQLEEASGSNPKFYYVVEVKTNHGDVVKVPYTNITIKNVNKLSQAKQLANMQFEIVKKVLRDAQKYLSDSQKRISEEARTRANDIKAVKDSLAQAAKDRQAADRKYVDDQIKQEKEYVKRIVTEEHKYVNDMLKKKRRRRKRMLKL